MKHSQDTKTIGMGGTIIDVLSVLMAQFVIWYILDMIISINIGICMHF